ncbi:MAG: COX15/CtaA family protein [Candidatus Dadabacteria bacterium]
MQADLDRRRKKPVAIWLLIGVFMIIIQVILGGITRLTDSGLSITEWKPILGAIPPLNDKDWVEAFNHYKQIAQFKHLHSYFTLQDFKSIYFWEWLHREWGRFIGIVFAVPFIIFIIQKRFSREMIKPMVILFLLGGLQGLIGWIMVQSGLNEENLYVSHIRLAIHFILALGLLVYTFWFALLLLVRQRDLFVWRSSKRMLIWITILLVIQLVYGAFMAGLKAAVYAPTWPTINGEYIPAHLGTTAGTTNSFLASLVNDPITVQFIHRNLAYILIVLILIWTFSAIKERSYSLFNTTKWLPLIMLLAQVVLGILAVIKSPYKIPQHWGVFEWYAQLHQFVAIVLLLTLVTNVFLLRRK